jgi:threonine dehydrogenase-like Zn-dependent dehydrogenase
VPGCEVQLIDTQPARAAIATRLGVAFASPDAARGDADLVLHASGNPQGLVTALGLAAFEARVVEASWYGRTAVALPLGEAFHSRRLQLVSSQVGQIAAAQRSRWSHRRRMALALALLAADELDALVTDSAPFDQLPAVLARLAAGASSTLCQRIDYP